jgi:hypothetical protein
MQQSCPDICRAFRNEFLHSSLTATVSLNLAGVHAAKQDSLVVTFFGTIESVYLFFSRSTLRWEKLKKALHTTVKRESETRWSARTEAVNAIPGGLDELVELLEKLCSPTEERVTDDTAGEAAILLQNVLNFSFLVLLYFWQDVLARIDESRNDYRTQQ